MKEKKTFYFKRISASEQKSTFPVSPPFQTFHHNDFNFVKNPQRKHFFRVFCCVWMSQMLQESLSAKLLPNLLSFAFVHVSFLRLWFRDKFDLEIYKSAGPIPSPWWLMQNNIRVEGGPVGKAGCFWSFSHESRTHFKILHLRAKLHSSCIWSWLLLNFPI